MTLQAKIQDLDSNTTLFIVNRDCELIVEAEKKLIESKCSNLLPQEVTDFTKHNDGRYFVMLDY